MKIYHVETQQDYDALMVELEEKGCKWRGEERKKLTDFDEFKTYGKDTYIYEEYGIISFSDGYYFKAHRSNEPLIEYKAKGEEMKQKEMKQKEMKQNIIDWATDVSVAVEAAIKDIKFEMKKSTVEADLQEAKFSAKKLIESIDDYLESQKHEFKVGDYVTVDVNGRKIISKIDKLWEHTAEAHGLWYDKTKVNVKQDFWFISKIGKCRHARPTEIEEYESALTFYKHGRKPFEVKKGDILRDDEGNILINDDNILSADFPKNLKKHYFTSGKYTLLKTVEEYNEWLKTAEEVNECLENK